MILYRGCGTTSTKLEVALAEADFKERKALAKLTVGTAEKVDNDTIITIPLAWHVIYQNETLEGGYLLEEQVEEGVQALNEHYK